MMELPKTYSPQAIEEKWYAYWLKQNFFHSEPDEREPYTIVIPPPNVTGVLHMGHMLNNTIQDILIRKARMEGKNACWVPGTDHASIATEAKVVAMLKEKGIDKKDLTREEFLKYAWEWKEKYGGIILKQLEKLGASCDWQRTRFTMEDDLSEAVIDVFLDLYKKGQIYRGVRMVNWDPQGLTAISDEEVIHKEVSSKLFYVKYQIEGTSDWITVATTRPETILGDTAICVHPADERYKNLAGKRAIVPICKRSVPIIFDDYIDLEFGTGALKVTPAHDINDYNLGVKHKLEVIDTLTDDGKLSAAAGFYVGQDRFAVRKLIVKDLEELGQIEKIEEIKNKVGTSERTGAVIEPKLSMQWFLKMDKISKPALDNVLNNEIKLIPEKFVNTYKHWMENVHDWCISRQLWWGQQIPAWYDEKGNFVGVAKTAEEMAQILKEEGTPYEKITQDPDVLDTWFSSWLWPISVFDGFKNPDNPDINYYYPTNDLVTAPEILFFWVARMIIAGYEYRKEKPFTNVYLTGIVRDKQGRKMSKSLGNSPDPIDLINKFGADGVRLGMLICSPAGNDLLFDESYCLQGRNFTNKIWNAFLLMKGWQVDEKLTGEENKTTIEWFENWFSQRLTEIQEHYSKYRMSEALMGIYKLIWDDFCSWYLEMIKPDFVDGKSLPIDSVTYKATFNFFENLLKVLHPIMPFITEEIYHLMAERTEKDCICMASYPTIKTVNETLLLEAEQAFEAITAIREIRAKAQKKNHETISVQVKGTDRISLNSFQNKIQKLCKITHWENVEKEVEAPKSFVLKGYTFFIQTGEVINVADEKAKLLEELNYTKGFLESVNKKLSNDRFVSSAPAKVLEIENKKREDAINKIALLEKMLA